MNILAKIKGHGSPTYRGFQLIKNGKGVLCFITLDRVFRNVHFTPQKSGEFVVAGHDELSFGQFDRYAGDDALLPVRSWRGMQHVLNRFHRELADKSSLTWRTD